MSQPSHPWTAGASHLYTREFMQLAHDHLTPDGVFVQWMNVIFMDEDLLRSLTATLLSVFREVRVYRPDPNTVVFLASDKPLDLELQLAQTGYPLRGAPLHYARFGINNAEDLVAALVLDADGARRIAAGAPLITDDDNRIATSSVYEKGLGMNGDTSGRLLAAIDPLQRADSFIYTGRSRISSRSSTSRGAISVFVLLDPSLADRIGAHGADPRRRRARANTLRVFYFRMQRQIAARDRAAAARHRRISGATTRCAWNILRGWFVDWRRDKAPPEIMEVAARLEPRPAAHVSRPPGMRRERRMARGGAWPIRSSPKSPGPMSGIAEALELRVNWRTRVTDADRHASASATRPS